MSAIFLNENFANDVCMRMQYPGKTYLSIIVLAMPVRHWYEIRIGALGLKNMPSSLFNTNNVDIA